MYVVLRVASFVTDFSIRAELIFNNVNSTCNVLYGEILVFVIRRGYVRNKVFLSNCFVGLHVVCMVFMFIIDLCSPWSPTHAMSTIHNTKKSTHTAVFLNNTVLLMKQTVEKLEKNLVPCKQKTL